MKSLLKHSFVLAILLAYVTSSIHAQTWLNAGFTPGQEIGYEKDGNTLWKLTINNIYKSTNGGASWVQNVDQANAPFYAADYFNNNFGTTKPTFDHEDSRVLGDFMFLGLRTGCCSASEFWTTPDAGLTFNKFEFDGDFFLEAYNLGNNRYMIQVADFDNSHPSFYRSKWYLSTNGGQSFNQVMTQYGRNARIVDQVGNSIRIHDADKIYYHNIFTLNLTQTINLPEDAITASVEGNVIRAISYDVDQYQTATNLRLHSSTNGGASFSTINNTKPAGFIFDFSIVDDFFFFDLGVDLYRYNLNNFSAAANIFATDVTPAGPFKKTLDGTAMVNKEVRIFNGSEFTFNNPFYTSTNNWSSVTPTPKIPFSLEALAQFGNSYSRFYGNDAFSTTNGFDFQSVEDFFGSALKDDIVYLEDAMYISVYSDPSSTAWFSDDGANFTQSKDLNGISATDADFFQAGTNLIIRPVRVGDPLSISTNNGASWSEVPNSYAWGRFMFADQKNGTLYGYQKLFGGDESIEMAKSTDNGVTWSFVDTNIPDVSQTDFNGREGRPFMAYNNHIFLKNGEQLLRSSDGGVTFSPVSFPNSVHNACVWINDGKLRVDTHDEQIYTVDIDQWLGSAPASSPAGYQIDLALDIRLEPANPAPFSDFDVIVTLTNQGSQTANRIGVRQPFLSSPVAVNRGSEQPTYSPNFAWTNTTENSLAPGESATASFPFFRLDGGDIETSSYVSSALQPDVDSRPGAIFDETNPEDDEAIYPNVTPTSQFEFTNCPSNITVTAAQGGNGAIVNYTDPTFLSNCQSPLAVFGPANGTASGNFFPIGSTQVLWTASNAECGIASCTFNVTVIAPNNGGGGGSNGIDLELSMTQSIANPTAFTTFDRTVIITNTGDEDVFFTSVSIPLFDGMVFSGGEEWVASQGFYGAYSNQIWNVNNLAAGASAEITLTYFALENISSPGYAEVFELLDGFNSVGQDIDSTPNNGTPPSVNEDDEASTDPNAGGGNGGGNNGLVLTCPGDFIIAIPSGDIAGVVVYDFSATTDCTVGVTDFDIDGIPSGVEAIFGDYLITITATDACGQTQTCSFTVTLQLTPVEPTQVICVDDITVTAPNENGALVTWDTPEVISQCSPFLLRTFPASGSLLPIGITEVEFVYGETGPGAICGSATRCVFNVTVLAPDGEGSNGIDLELSMAQNESNPTAFNTFQRTVTVNNTGTESADRVFISIPLLDGMVFSGGEEFTTTQGGYSPYGNQLWSVGNLLPGESESITLTYFALENISNPGYAQVFSMEGSDVDSTPNNGTPPTVNEDDEASTDESNGGGNGNGGGNTGNLPDLTVSNFIIADDIVLNELTSYTFDLNNLGNIAASEDYSVELFLSNDNTFSNNDVFVGNVRTGNTFPGTIPNINAQLIAASFATGQQNLIVVVDANDEIEESNENNNITVYNVNVVDPMATSDGADINLSVVLNESTQTQYEAYSITYTATNEGNESTSNVEIDVPVPTGVVYSGGEEFEATKGSLGIYFDDVWRVGSLSPGESAELSITYYKLSSGAIQHYAQVKRSDGDDPDSTPNNGQCCTAVEDDEASISTNSIQARTSDNNASANTFTVIDVVPNPSDGQRVVLRLDVLEAQTKEIYIYDLLGKQAVVQKENLVQGYNEVTLRTQDLPSGYYQVLIEDINMRLVPTRFIIDRL